MHMCACVSTCVCPLQADAVEQASGQDVTHQLRHSQVAGSAKFPPAMFLSYSSFHSSLGLRPQPKFSRFSPGRWGLLAPFRSSGSTWETQGASGAQMSPSLGICSAMTGWEPGWGLWNSQNFPPPDSAAPAGLQPHQPFSSVSLLTLMASLSVISWSWLDNQAFQAFHATPHLLFGLTSGGPFPRFA